MIIKLDQNKYLKIDGSKNSLSHLKDNYIYLLPLFIELYTFMEKYGQKTKDGVITLLPNDFYHFGNNRVRNRLLITQNEYYAFQIYNLLMLPEHKSEALMLGFSKQSELDSRFHNIGKGGPRNKKYLLKDRYGGFLEAVYDEEGQLVLDHVNDGTYNFYHNHPLHIYDITLWLMYGVLGYDKLSVNERVNILKSNLNDIYHYQHH